MEMFGARKKRGGELLVAHSNAFGTLLKDITGNHPVEMSRKTGVSQSYASAMLSGNIPSEEVLARIVQAYDLDDELSERLFSTAREARPDVDDEALIHTACIAGGLSTSDRIAVLTFYRERKKQAAEQQSAA